MSPQTAVRRVTGDARQCRLSTASVPLITVDGLTFRDLDGDGRLAPYEDWRLSPAERASDLVDRMSPAEKLGLMVITSRPMGRSQKDPALTSHDGLLDEEHQAVHRDPHNSSGKPFQGTTEMIRSLGIRHFIMRETPSGGEIARWVNAMQEVAEATRWSIPVLVAANSKNEAGGFVMGATGDDVPFTQFPGTLGLAAAHDPTLVRRFAEQSRREWVASGLRKGYMYMADTVTDPRWFRTYGTFGEDPELVARAVEELVRGFQAGDGEELATDGVALTVKHFPGGGARENGFDPHYAEGRFNVYRTPGSLERYHLPPFRAAIEAGAASVMPYYAIPSEEKSSLPQGPFETFEQVGFAFNAPILELLRSLGHRGYVNSDSGILNKMAWGVEKLTVPERVGRAVTAGTDIIADTNDVGSFQEAFLHGHITAQRMDEAASLLLAEMFALGLFDDPFADPEVADGVVACREFEALADEAHRRSVVLVKNSAGLPGPGGREGTTAPVLPLTPERLQGRRVYLELFEKDLTVRDLTALRAAVADAHPEVAFTTDVHDADVAIVLANPSTGDYFSATGLVDLEVHEATNVELGRIREIRENVEHLVIALNARLCWLPGNLETLADAMLIGFDTRWTTVVEAILGSFSPTGRLPVTFPIDEAAVAVDEDGICASPNDVPGYAKEQHMAGRPYVYVDADGHRWERGHGLGYEEADVSRTRIPR